MDQQTVRYEWSEIPWRKIEASIFKLQKRIYQASQRGNVKLVHKLQRLLLKSRSAKLLAIRRVTQDNQGRKTAGIDGIAKLNQKQRLQLVNELNLNMKSKPVRRIWIPKPGSLERRPLGIPTMIDRAKQALVKLALEPEWEAKFEPNSYGFRPGRSCHDAYSAIFEAIKRKPAFILDADIAGCFDNINHNALLKKLNTSSVLRRTINGWLKAGLIENDVFQSTERGTPQGGIISPLLANVALHGLENDIKHHLSEELFQYMKAHAKKASRMLAQRAISIIRYADDFIIMHKDLDIIMKAKLFAERWLKDVGLEMKQSKTRIAHTLNSIGEEKPGFDFLGFTVRQFPLQQSKKGYKLLIKPSRKSQKRHAKIIRDELRKLRAAPQEMIIRRLNPIVDGWSRYFLIGVSRKVFERLDHDMHGKLWRWAKIRHPQKGTGWIKRKYFRQHGNDVWRFKTHEGMFLKRHSDHLIKRHIKVKGTKSPYDGDWTYWVNRLEKLPGISTQKRKLLKLQQGKCGRCSLWFYGNEQTKVYHKDHKYTNNRIGNLTLLHLHCYDIAIRGMNDKH